MGEIEAPAMGRGQAERGELDGGPLVRVAGVAGLAFVAGVVLQNGVLLAGNPQPDAPLEEIVDFYRDGGGRIGVAVGLVALNIVLLLCFASGIAERISAVPRARIAGRAGFGAAVLLGGAFLTTTALQAVLTTRVDELADAGLVQVIWDLHGSAFSMSATGLAAVLVFFALGSLLGADLVPRWTAILALVGSGLLVAAGALAAPSVDGGPGLYLQLGGFVTWLVFLVVASLRLLRR